MLQGAGPRGLAVQHGEANTEPGRLLFEHVALHATKSHPDMKMDDATKQHVNAAVKTI